VRLRWDFYLFFLAGEFLTLQYRDKSADDARGDPEYREPEKGEADAVFRWYIVKGEEGNEGGVTCPKAVDRDRDGGNGGCYG